MDNAILNFSESLDSSNTLNFGAVDKDDKTLTYYYDFNLELEQYESLFVSLEKMFVTEQQQVKTIRLSLINSDTGKASKRFFGAPLRGGSSERYALEATYKKHLKPGYILRLEILVTDEEQVGSVEIDTLIKNLKVYLKRDRNDY